jgi:radical SAM protein with 4Fe4S-binding SPASM domain
MKKFKKIYVEITNNCNLNCPFCSKDNNVKKSMTIDEFNYILNQIKSYSDYIYLHVKGEPLLNKDLNEFLKICEKNNIKVNITTNGTLLKSNLDIILNNKCIRQINISLHSFYQDDKNKLDKYMDDIIYITKEILTKTNIIISYRLWNMIDNKNNSLNLNVFNIIKDKFNLSDEVHNKIILDKSIKIMNNLYLNKDNLFEWPSLEYKDLSEGTCYGLKDHIAILVDGTVVPCCLDSEGIINLGNIYQEQFSDILAKEKTKKIINNFKNKIAVEELCKKCTFKNRFK